MNTLIAYATKYGCTEKCAEMLSKELVGNVDIINLKKVKDVDLSKYDKVIIGGSIYIGRIQKEVKAFCSKHMEELKQKRVGLFICAMQEEDTIDTVFHANFAPELLEMADARGYFGGEYRFEKMSFLERWMVKMVSKATTSQSNLLEDNIHKFAQAMNAL